MMFVQYPLIFFNIWCLVWWGKPDAFNKLRFIWEKRCINICSPSSRGKKSSNRIWLLNFKLISQFQRRNLNLAEDLSPANF